MGKKVAPPKNTGGGGFEFEDDVCAWLLACMLAGERVFGPALGVPVRIDFQTRALKWFLADALVTMDAGGARHRVALSVKSNPQLSARKAPKDFVDAIWTQWLQIGSKAFDSGADVMGLVIAPVSGAARASIDGLMTKAGEADPKLFPGLLAEPTWASKDQRVLFASFACPPALVAKRNDGSKPRSTRSKRPGFSSGSYLWSGTLAIRCLRRRPRPSSCAADACGAARSPRRCLLRRR